MRSKYFVSLNIMYMYRGISDLLDTCAEDIRTIAIEGGWFIEAQERAYDLISELCDMTPEALAALAASRQGNNFLFAYDDCHEYIEGLYDESELHNSLKARLAPLERACTDARFEAASAASLHEFAKETFDIWQTAGIFMRKRALKALRERAGFKLESHRIGNYVAKTFDLMNEAQIRFAKAQQAVFTANVAYKIQPGLYERIAELLSDTDSAE